MFHDDVLCFLNYISRETSHAQAQRRKEVQEELEALGEQLRSQIESVVDMCEECVREAEEALSQTESLPKPPEDDNKASDASQVSRTALPVMSR